MPDENGFKEYKVFLIHELKRLHDDQTDTLRRVESVFKRQSEQNIAMVEAIARVSSQVKLWGSVTLILLTSCVTMAFKLYGE